MNRHSTSINHGVLDIEYHNQRLHSKALSYRMNRRADEVAEAIIKCSRAFSVSEHECIERPMILDIGAADMLGTFRMSRMISDAGFVAMEYSKSLLNTFQEVSEMLDFLMPVSGDGCCLPFKAECFDAVTMAAVIEHLEDPVKALIDAKRVLKPGGIVVITAPHPFWEHAAVLLGHLKDGDHRYVPDRQVVGEWAEMAGLQLKVYRRFMLSPIGMPAERQVEKLFRKLGLSFMMANQLFVLG